MFDSIDWKIESERVRKAFGIQGEFREHGDDKSRVLFSVGSVDNRTPFFKIMGELLLGIAYTREIRVFRVFHLSKGNKSMTNVEIPWSDLNRVAPRISLATCTREGNLVLARGLRKLGLMTPELVVGLNNSVTGHEKIEWETEFSEYL